MPRLLVDISAHGYGHLGQTAPILNALARVAPDLDLTIRSGLPRETLVRRVAVAFRHVAAATDFGYVMQSAIDLDLPATARRYRSFHETWAQRVAAEAEWLTAEGFDLILSNVAYLPLAGAAQAGVAAVAVSSLNWADLFRETFCEEPWAAQVHEEMLAAYRSARAFLRLTPGMPMSGLGNVKAVGPVCRLRAADRAGFAGRQGVDAEGRWLLVAMGGMDFPIDFSDWPKYAGTRYWVPVAPEGRDDMTAFDRTDIDFTALLASCDAVVTKPGYATFVEAACHGRPVLYVPREGWAEEQPLTDWLHRNVNACAVERERLLRGNLAGFLDDLLFRPPRSLPTPTGIADAVEIVAKLLKEAF